ncbi:hypothetical protein Goklo_000009, partial [Gossypium klotzschianum]|nr:hypothetical protein [Gossypium klotzschianum]
MEVGVETAELGWDLSIRAQSRRAHPRENNSRGTLDLVLGANLIGRGYHTGEGSGNGRGNMENSLMEHDLEDVVIIGEEGK